jgi:hypothetical protein
VTRLDARKHLAVRLAAATVAGVGIMLASGCGAGQIAETANLVPAVPGGSGTVAVPALPSDPSSGGTVSVQNVTFDYNGPAGYPVGSSVPISVRIINTSGVNLELTGVQAAAVQPPGDLGTVALVSASASVGTPSAAPSALPTPSGSVSPSAPASPSPAPAAPLPISVKIPAEQLVDLSTQVQQYLAVTGLTQALLPGDRTVLTFSFTDTSDPSAHIADIVVPAQIGPPRAPIGRTTIPNAPTD